MQSHKGFSLLEAMIAGFILFMVLVAVSSLFTTATKSSMRATSAAELHYQVPLILERVRYELHEQDQQSGQGSWQSLTYRWQAELQQTKALWYNEVLNQADASDQKVELWQVTLTVELDGAEREFTYQEVSW